MHRVVRGRGGGAAPPPLPPSGCTASKFLVVFLCFDQQSTPLHSTPLHSTPLQTLVLALFGIVGFEEMGVVGSEKLKNKWCKVHNELFVCLIE